MKIGLIGHMGSGKTTIANQITEKYDCVRLAFADKLKEDIVKFQLTEDGTIQKLRDRALLQNYGQLRRAEIKSVKYCKGELVNFSNSLGTFFYKKSGNKATNYESLGMSYPDYWVEYLEKKIRSLHTQNKSIVIDDVRRLNELQMLRTNGFLIIKIECETNKRLERLKSRDGDFNNETLKNISETEIDLLNYDHIINNNGDVNDAIEHFEKIIK